jgi:pantetheine-phosphate adenylyltransferase
MKKEFKTVGVGGTFDKFHKGHRAILTKAFEFGNIVLIGLCTDEFARNLRKNHEIASYEDRKKELQCFLKKRNLLSRVKIIPLENSYGPAVSSLEQEAIVVSRETEPVAHEINKVRKQNGLSPLEVIRIDMIPAEDQVSISTTRISHGEIDKEGHLLEK